MECRHAFFSTGLKYEFMDSIQPSSDIRAFGGIITTSNKDLNRGHYKHSWNYEKDAPIMFEILKEDSDMLPDFNAFPTNLTGTCELRKWFYKLKNDQYGDFLWDWYYKFELGCVIYHQLLYEPNLYVSYEP